MRFCIACTCGRCWKGRHNDHMMQRKQYERDPVKSSRHLWVRIVHAIVFRLQHFLESELAFVFNKVSYHVNQPHHHFKLSDSVPTTDQKWVSVSILGVLFMHHMCHSTESLRRQFWNSPGTSDSTSRTQLKHCFSLLQAPPHKANGMLDPLASLAFSCCYPVRHKSRCLRCLFAVNSCSTTRRFSYTSPVRKRLFLFCVLKCTKKSRGECLQSHQDIVDGKAWMSLGTPPKTPKC